MDEMHQFVRQFKVSKMGEINQEVRIRPIQLNDKEQSICELLRQVCLSLPEPRPVLRIAGGWVRDKVGLL